MAQTQLVAYPCDDMFVRCGSKQLLDDAVHELAMFMRDVEDVGEIPFWLELRCDC